MTTPKRVLIALTNHDQLGDTGKATGFYLSEAADPYLVFRGAGYAVDFVSPRGGLAPMDGIDRTKPNNVTFLDDAEAVEGTRHSLAAAEVDPHHYRALFFAGGHGTMWDFPDNAALRSLTQKMYEQGGVVGAVCHGPAALVNVRLSNGRYLVEGKPLAAFTNEEEAAVELTGVVPFLLESRLRERGALVQCGAKFQKNVVVSERLVTGQNPASAEGVAQEVVRRLTGPRYRPTHHARST